jgi:uncharacterized protein (TIGR00730 family)
MRSICVFCGSSFGLRPTYAQAAATLGQALAQRELGLVYGGARVGLMGVVADSVLGAGGKVTGVLPRFMADKEVAHYGLTELIEVDSMHERKAKMAERADAFVVLPGGFGTLEEMMEVLTWAQLGLHRKPCGLLNIDGYYDPLCTQIDYAVRDGFLKPAHREILIVEDDVDRLLARLFREPLPIVTKWLPPDAT